MPDPLLHFKSADKFNCYSAGWACCYGSPFTAQAGVSLKPCSTMILARSPAGQQQQQQAEQSIMK